MWHLKWSLVAVFIFVGSLCEAHLNQPQQAFVGAQGGGQMMMQQQQQQVAHPAAGYGAAAQVGHHQVQPQMQHPPPNGGNMLRDKSQIQDRAHIQEHLQEILGDGQDLSKMTEEELQFHYFKLHDNDDNNRLDGLELVKSLIHWHVEEHKHMQASQGSPNPNQAGAAGGDVNGHATTKIFNDMELQQMIDPILEMDDTNRDGYIDYPEFVAAQKQRGF